MRLLALLQPLAANFLKVAVDGVAFGDRELGEWVFDLAQLQIAAFSYLNRSLYEGRMVWEDTAHLIGTLYEELIAVEAETLGVMNLCTCLHAEHHVVSVRVLAAKIVRVVGEDHGNFEFTFQSEERLVNLLLLLK